MSIHDVDLDRIAQEIWSTVLGVTLQHTPAERAHPAGAEIVTGTVQITGDWNGVVAIECSSALARSAATAMFDTETHVLSPDDLRDSIGELANMAGGNVKSLLGSSCELTLPAVTVGRDYHVSIPGSRQVNCHKFDCEGELLIVSTLERHNG